MTTFLQTKLTVPPVRPNLVIRPRLINKLAAGLNGKLTLVSAPAGFGKTTLLAQWANSSPSSFAWVSLGRDDNDFERFFRYLFRAWEMVQPDIRDSSLGHLLGAMSPDSEALLSEFINLAVDLTEQTVFVLDDYHLIEEASIHQALTFLLDHLPPTLHFILAGRGEPPLPLSRYRASNELLELRVDDIQFLLKESEQFLEFVPDLTLKQEQVILLHTRLEGWVTGLQLAALTLQRDGNISEKLIVSGRHRFIADFLSEEVLDHLPEDQQLFLLQTSILDRLSASLCEAVTEQKGGQEMLEGLERENLFLVPLDNIREWFRYHRLFADFLRAELRRRHPKDVAAFHQRAARWYLAQDLPETAFEHAMQGNDVQLVGRIFEHHAQAKIIGGEVKILQRWCDAIPEAWYFEYPLLDLFRAGLLMLTGQLDDVIRHLEQVEQRLLSADKENVRPHLARISAIRCAIACFQNELAQAEIFADQASQNLPDEDIAFRSLMFGALGDTYRRNGRWAEAKACYLGLLDYMHAPAIRLFSAHMFGALADLELRQGRLRSAASYWQKALAAIEERENWGRLPLSLIGWVYIREGELLYEWNDLERAWEYVWRGLERAELGGDVRALTAGYLLAGRLKLTDSDAEAAAEYLEQARSLVESTQFSDWTGRFESLQLELWLAQGKLRTAVNWVDELLTGNRLTARPDGEVTQLALARLLIVKGDAQSVDQGLGLLQSLLQAAGAEGRGGVAIEALALQALAHQHLGKQGAALTTLEKALRLAEPEGYVRLLVDLGLPMVRLLQEARSRAVLPDYSTKLLTAFGSDLGIIDSEKTALLEPLTARESEVLQLIAAGLTNLEIAEELFIALETVKKHAGNIYGKLGVGNRTEAVARARELNLLD